MPLTEVILVDTSDRAIGKSEKMHAHIHGLLHRAITVYIFNSQGELLLQQRAKSKYHSGGYWSNSCCGHPMPRENTQAAAERRLEEEMGLQLDLTEIAEISYNLPVSNGLTEHEYAHIFMAISDQQPKLNPEEADECCYLPITDIERQFQFGPRQFTPWFRETFQQIITYAKACPDLKPIFIANS